MPVKLCQPASGTTVCFLFAPDALVAKVKLVGLYQDFVREYSGTVGRCPLGQLPRGAVCSNGGESVVYVNPVDSQFIASLTQQLLEIEQRYEALANERLAMGIECHDEQIQVGTQIKYTYPIRQPITTSGGASRSVFNLDDAMRDLGLMYEWVLTNFPNSQGYALVGSGGSVGIGLPGKPIPFYQFGQSNPNTGDVDPNGCIISCGPAGGCRPLCNYVRTFEEYVSVLVREETVPVYETRTVCTEPQGAVYEIFLPTHSDAQPVEQLFVTVQELEQLLAETRIQLAEIQARFETDPSPGRLKTINVMLTRISWMERELARIKAGIRETPSVDEIVGDVGQFNGTPVNQIVNTPEGLRIIIFDSEGNIVEVREPTEEELLNLPPPVTPPPTTNIRNIILIALGITGAGLGAYAVSRKLRRRR